MVSRHRAIQRPVLDGLQEVLREDMLPAVEVGTSLPVDLPSVTIPEEPAAEGLGAEFEFVTTGAEPLSPLPDSSSATFDEPLTEIISAGMAAPAPADKAPAGSCPSLGLGPVDLPAYLDRTQIVTRGEGNLMLMAEFDQWIEPVQANFTRGRGDLMGMAGALNDRADIASTIKSYQPNDYGLYCMAGNVNEWVYDVYRPLSNRDVAEFQPFRGNIFTVPSKDADGSVIRDEYGVMRLDTLADFRNF